MPSYAEYTETLEFALRDASSLEEVAELACLHISSLGAKNYQVVLICGFTSTPERKRKPPFIQYDTDEILRTAELHGIAIFDQHPFYRTISRLTGVSIEEDRFWLSSAESFFRAISMGSSLKHFLYIWEIGSTDRVRKELSIGRKFGFEICDDWQLSTEDDLPF